MRCPECGRPFTFAEVGSTPEQLEFAGTPDEARGAWIKRDRRSV
jgi:hypothetical protein